MEAEQKVTELTQENQTLRTRLEEAEETLRAILHGSVDALVVPGDDGDQIYTRQGANRPYRALVEAMSQGALTLAADGQILYANRYLAQMLNAPLEQIIGSDIFKWVSAGSRKLLQAWLTQSDGVDQAAENKKQRDEVQFITGSGLEISTYVSVNRLSLSGQADTFCLVATDLTDQKRNEAIVANEKLAQAILEQTTEAIVVCDANGQIIRANEMAHTLCERNPLGQMFQHVFDLQSARNTPFSLVEGPPQQQRRLEARLMHKGEALDLLVSIGPLYGPEQARLGTVVTLTDITERKRTEQAILSTQAELQRLLGEADQSRRALLSLVEDQQETEAALQERLKEMACLYAIRRDMTLGLSMDVLCQRIVNHLANAMQFPDLAVPVLEVNGRQYTITQHEDRPADPGCDQASLQADIVLNGEQYGCLCVYYTEKRPFIHEEQEMLNAIAEALQLWLTNEQSKAAQRESERLLNETQALSKIGGWQYNFTTEAVTWTEEVRRILGVSSDVDLTDVETSLSFYAEADRQRFIKEFLRAARENRPFEMELRCLTGDGQRKWVYTSGQPVYQEGEPIKMVGYIMDITERKQHEREREAMVVASAALRQAETQAEMLPIILDQLLDLLQADGASIALYDAETNTAVITEARGELNYGVGFGLPYNNSITGTVIKSGQSFVSKNIREEPALFRRDYFGSVRTAACVPLLARQAPIGAIWVGRQHEFTAADLRLLTAIADMTANAIYRAALHEQTKMQAEQINEIMNSTPDGVLLLDDQHTVVLANPAARTYLKQLAEKGVGDRLDELGGRRLAALLTTPTPGAWHTLVHNKRTFEAITRPLTAGPTTTGWVMVLRDVTQQRLVQQQLQQQERLAAIGQLAAGIAHDFNNLMAVITLYSQLLSQSPGLSARDQERLNIINQQSDHAVRMIQQILDFSRRSVLERQTLDLRPFLKEQIELLRRTLPEHIEIVWQSEADAYWVQADPTRIQQAVMNLALNARDAMPDGGQLTLALNQVVVENRKMAPLTAVTAGHWIELSITDTGIGIQPDHLDHLFEPFFTTKTPDKGTGLGLAQVHGIVAQHGGHITVQSQPGQGTVIAIYLPALTQPGEYETGPETAVVPQGQGELIMVVEDDMMLRMALTEYLEIWGYQTVSAENGEEALQVLSETTEPISLIISDVIMPRMGGINLFRALQAQNNQIPIILLTGHPLEEEMIATLRNEGLKVWLPKPPDLNQLAQAIASLLAKNRLPIGR
jgi:two-component system, cell cycle sensor histidine kinase and response regulator CckA